MAIEKYCKYYDNEEKILMVGKDCDNRKKSSQMMINKKMFKNIFTNDHKKKSTDDCE